MMNTAEAIIHRFGGQSALAARLKKRQSTVQYWAKAGLIPAKHQRELLRLAQEEGIDLSPADFVPIPNSPAADTSPGTELGQIAQVCHEAPEARWPGLLRVGDSEIPCYVLADGRRVISRNGATNVLTSGKGGGNLESYLYVEAVKGYLPEDLTGQMIDFSIPGVVNKTVRGISAETFLEICMAYVTAFDAGALKTERQIAIAAKAGMFLAACSKIGLIALIDEATGYQYARAQDALEFKLKLYLEEEMRKWEKTFPDELWKEFGRLTNWQGSVHHRPKYWGKLVMELVYGYLDPDVAEWLKKNAPKPRGGQNYHQWLTGQYGLRRLIEHLWMLIGMASACNTLTELKQKMAEKFGRQAVQFTMYLPPVHEPQRPKRALPAARTARGNNEIGLDVSPSSPTAGCLFPGKEEAVAPYSTTLGQFGQPGPHQGQEEERCRLNHG